MKSCRFSSENESQNSTYNEGELIIEELREELSNLFDVCMEKESKIKKLKKENSQIAELYAENE